MQENTPLQIIDTKKAVIQRIKERLGYKLWLIIGGGFIFDFLVIKFVKTGDGRLFSILLALPWVLLTIYYVSVWQSIRAEFWFLFAFNRGWKYQGSGEPSKEAGVMFHQGRNQKIYHVVEGSEDKRPLRIFELEFTIGHGKGSATLGFTVFEFKLKGHFPHFYLNQLQNGYGVRVGEVIPVPSEFQKQFQLSAPKEYEIEALQVFTPNVMAYLLDTQLKYDIELVEQELLIFKPGIIRRLDELEHEYDRALNLVKLFAPVLDKFRFTQIGDASYNLN